MLTSDSRRHTLRILGTRGVPAQHGGFETFAEQLSIYLVSRGWRVVVYCQEDGDGYVTEDVWQGVERVLIPVAQGGALGTIVFDWHATRHAARHNDLCLTLGYNTSVFGVLLRMKGVVNITNMDGIEWSRAKWGPVAKTWFWLNEWIGCVSSNHLVADNPEINAHLRSRVPASKITTIAYGAERVENVADAVVRSMGLRPGRYLTVIARAEPENSLLEVVSAFSRKKRGVDLVVLGKYDDENTYHRTVRGAASDEVRFVGAIYDKMVVQALRAHSLAYIHGHQVGGTNPSLVEALGAGNAVIAHDNRFNRWVCGEHSRYFDGADSAARVFDTLLADDLLLATMRAGSVKRFEEQFTWAKILGQYESLLETWDSRRSTR